MDSKDIITSISQDAREIRANKSFASVVRADQLRGRKGFLGWNSREIKTRTGLSEPTISSILNGSMRHQVSDVAAVGLAMGMIGELSFRPITADGFEFLTSRAPQTYAACAHNETWAVIGERNQVIAMACSESLALLIAALLNSQSC